MKRSAWVDTFLLVAAIKVAVGLVGLISPLPAGGEAIGGPPTSISVLNTVVFGGAAALLVFAGRHDRRAVHLGTFFLLVATSFAHPGIRRLVPSLSPAFAPLIESASRRRQTLMSSATAWSGSRCSHRTLNPARIGTARRRPYTPQAHPKAIIAMKIATGFMLMRRPRMAGVTR